MERAKNMLKDLQTPLESFQRIFYGVWNKQVCTYHVESRKRVSVGGMELSSGEVIPEIESDKGFLEADEIIHTKMKDKIQKE